MQKFANDPDPRRLLCFNVYAAHHAFNRFYQPLLEPLGLTYPQFLVMIALHRQDGRGVGSLAEELMLETNTLSPLLKRIEGMGLITRRRSQEDERRVDVFLTDQGRDLAVRAAEIPDCIAECFDGNETTYRMMINALTNLRQMLAKPEE